MLKEIIKFLIAGGFITSTFIYLSKILINRFFARDLEKFKSELEKELTKYKTQFGQLHLEKAQAIKEIFFEFHDIKNLLSEKSTKAFFLSLSEGKLDAKELIEYDQKVVILRGKIEKNSLFFTDSLVEEMLNVVASYQCGIENAESARDLGINNRDEKRLELDVLLNGKVLEPLRKEFKKILGDDL